MLFNYCTIDLSLRIFYYEFGPKNHESKVMRPEVPGDKFIFGVTTNSDWCFYLEKLVELCQGL